MSTLKVNAISDTAAANGNAITLDTDGTCTAKITNNLSHRNKVINGNMAISQRATSFTSTGSEYIIDRFIHTNSASLSFDTTTTQDSSGPDGFRKCLKITPDSTQTPTGSMNGLIQTKIEGQDLQDLAFGTSSAKKITLSFYAKSAAQNNNHQYSVQLRKYNDGNDRNMVNRAFTVTSSWQRFTMTFNGDTSENIRNDHENGMQIIFHLCNGPDDIAAEVSTFSRTTNSGLYTAVTGQSNFMDNTSNEFYLTGVQLEVSDHATEFEHRTYGEELARCKRYYHKRTGHMMMAPYKVMDSPDMGRKFSIFFNEMRVAPTVTGITHLTNGSTTVSVDNAYVDHIEFESGDVADDTYVRIDTYAADSEL